MKRYLPTFIALLLALLMFASCGGNAGTDVPDTAATDADETIAETEAENLKDNLGAYDFGGEEFTFYSRLQATPNFHGALFAAEETGEILNDTILRRNRTIEERFNYVMTEVLGTTTDAARTAVLAGDDTYKVISTRCSYAFDYACEGLLYPVTDLPEIDLDRAYWDAKLTSDMTVLHKMYFAVGTFNLTSYDFTHVLLFNKKMAEDYNIGNLYGIVSDGQWTFDRFGEIAGSITADTDGSGTMDAEDTYGFVSAGKQVPPCFWISGGVLSVSKNADDIPVFEMKENSRFLTVLERVYNITWDNNAWMYTSSDENVPTVVRDQFRNGKALFLDCTCFHIEDFRAMETDFGIIPFPKYDEAQDEYCSRIEGCELFCVPVTNNKLEMTSVILEAMASESAQYLLPVYYDVILTSKYTRDSESAEMLDIIYGNRIFDYGDTIWCDLLRDKVLKDMYKANNRDFASKVESLTATVQDRIDKTVEAFKAL